MKETNSLRRAASKLAGVAFAGAMLAFPLVMHAQPAALKALNNGFTDTGSFAGLTTSKTLPQLVGSFIQTAIGLLGVILVVLVIYAGFLWMTAQGNEEKIKKAKSMITSAVIGIVIIFAAYAITNWVVGALSTATT